MNQRILKFRAWDPEDKVMFSWKELNESTNAYAVLGHITRLIPEQFTDLKDNNGIEIYEGDIIELHDTLFDVQTGEPKRFLKQVSIPEIYQSRDVEICTTLEVGKVKRGLEVIGNIHENPELLK